MADDGKLDAFIPSAETLAGVRRQLVDAGVDPINEEWLLVVVSAMTKWQTTTADGMRFFVNSLGFCWKDGEDDKVYRYIDPQTQTVYDINPKDIHFFSGSAVRGVPIDVNSLEVYDRKAEQCEGCGICAHCLKEVRDPISDRLERLCNNCLWQSDNFRIKDQGDPMICEECTVTHCYHHPRRQRSRQA